MKSLTDFGNIKEAMIEQRRDKGNAEENPGENKNIRKRFRVTLS